MKLRKVVALTLVMIMCFTLGVGASSLQKNITVVQDKGVTVKVDGSKLNLGDKAPLMYEGTTYLPVRAVAEAVGKPVNWDNDTRTVILGLNDNKVKLTSDMLFHGSKTFTKEKDQLTLGAYSVSEGILFKSYQDFTVIKLDSKYSKLVFTVLSENEKSPTITVEKAKYEDFGIKIMEQLMSDKLNSGIDSKTYEVDVTNCDMVWIRYSNSGGKVTKIIGDMYFQ